MLYQLSYGPTAAETNARLRVAKQWLVCGGAAGRGRGTAPSAPNCTRLGREFATPAEHSRVTRSEKIPHGGSPTPCGLQAGDTADYKICATPVGLR